MKSLFSHCSEDLIVRKEGLMMKIILIIKWKCCYTGESGPACIKEFNHGRRRITQGRRSNAGEVLTTLPVN